VLSTERLRGLTLIELLVVIAVIALLAAILFPVMAGAKVRAKVARVQVELKQIGDALEMYREDYRGYPPARTYCMGAQMQLADYNELPPELRRGYLGSSRMEDPFNPGRSYKYLAPGPGFSNGSKTILALWAPKDYPLASGGYVPYYKADQSPVKWGVWSVGPSGPVDVFTSEERLLPVAPDWWYPHNGRGIIVRLSDGRTSR